MWIQLFPARNIFNLLGIALMRRRPVVSDLKRCLPGHLLRYLVCHDNLLFERTPPEFECSENAVPGER